MRRWRLSLEPWGGMGRPLGWAGTLSPRVGRGCGFPLGCGSSLGLGWVTGRSWGRIVLMYEYRQGVDVTFREGTPPHSVLETLRLRSGRTEFPAPVDEFLPTQAQQRGSQRSGRFASLPLRGEGKEGLRNVRCIGQEYPIGLVFNGPMDRLRELPLRGEGKEGEEVGEWRAKA